MNLHEYQAKALLSTYGVPIPYGEVASSVDEAVHIANAMSDPHWVVKAQVHAGGRGKAGGVKLVESEASLIQVVTALLGKRLITKQTTAQGQPVNRVLIEEPCDIQHELYLSLLIDRTQHRIVLLVAMEGGMDIEEVMARSPEKMLKIVIDPLIGLQPYQMRELAFSLKLKKEWIAQFVSMGISLYRLFTEKDVNLLEVNPLVVTKKGQLLCLDVKMSIDDNALYRQKPLLDLRDISQEDERENRAREWALNYVALEGDIGCMVNGAGLAMATMDLIQLHGGRPANFLDVGGSATAERVTEAFKIILLDTQIKVILINIFGGIVRCDLIAEGIISAVSEVEMTLPVVVRLEGNHAELGLKKLKTSGLNIIPATSFNDAAQKAVDAAVRNERKKGQ